jgi:endogenous inhibitor of DNA gyrase (YacG/DUF329 family)
MATLVHCPQCGKATEWRADNPWRPFCSERCKLIDLGQWASEKYRIAGEEQKENERKEDDEQKEEKS